MALPEVGQASLLADIFERALREFRPGSVAVVGCAGGNGLDRIDRTRTTRVVGIDVNPAYLEAARHGTRESCRGWSWSRATSRRGLSTSRRSAWSSPRSCSSTLIRTLRSRAVAHCSPREARSAR